MKKYQIIYADPAWDMSYAKETKEGINVYDLPYNTMSDEELIALNVKSIVSDDAILFLWCIDSRIELMPYLMETWGFKYKTVGFVWNKVRKDHFGVNATLGKYTRKSCEFCFIGSRGKYLVKEPTIDQYVPCPKSEHSSKPDIIRQKIVDLCGDLPRIELFARKPEMLFESPTYIGWDVWGNEVESDINLL